MIDVRIYNKHSQFLANTGILKGWHVVWSIKVFLFL